MSQNLGALPPEGFEWQIGKTAASILFVNRASGKLSLCNGLEEAQKLLAAIEQVKQGSIHLGRLVSPEDFLKNGGFLPEDLLRPPG
jgi:hypothetical protein